MGLQNLLLAEIEALVSRGQKEDAVRRLREFLGTAEPNDAASIADDILGLTARLSSEGLASDTRGCEAIMLRLLLRGPRDEQKSYSLVQRALYRGQIDFVIDYGREMRDLSWRLHALVARALADEFLFGESNRMRSTMTTDERTEKLKQISRECTDHYEAAVSQVPGQYEKTQLAYQWLSVKGSFSTFSADSPLMTRQFPNHALFKCTAAVEEHVQAQAGRIRAAVRHAIESGRQSQQFADATRNEIARSFEEEFKIYAKIDIPEHVLDCIIRDIPFFFDRGMPMELIEDRAGSDLRELAGMFKWYLWQAIILPVPDDYEQSRIEEQVAGLAKRCIDQLTDPNVPEECVAAVRLKMDQWKAMYRELKENRFVPYFKRPLTRYRQELVDSALARGLTNTKNDLKGPATLARQNGIYSVADISKQSAFSILVLVVSDYTYYDRPSKTHLPGEVFHDDSGTLNKYLIGAWIPGQGIPF